MALPAAGGFDDTSVQNNRFNLLVFNNDHLFSGMVDEKTPNPIPFTLATIKLLNGTNEQLEAAYKALRPKQAARKDPDVPIRSAIGIQASYGSYDRLCDFRSYYSKQLVEPGAPVHVRVIDELFSDDERPLWFGLFACFGLPLVCLGDAVEVRHATYATQALTLAAANWDDALAGLFAKIARESARRRAAAAALRPLGPGPGSSVARGKPATSEPMALLQNLAYDGRLSNLPMALPGYHEHRWRGEALLGAATVVEAVEQCVWQAGLDEATDLDAFLGELGRIAVGLACGTHKTAEGGAPPEFDFYLCFLPTLVHAMRVFLREFGGNFKVFGARLAMVRCLWAVFVLVYVAQLRPRLDWAQAADAGPLAGPFSAQDVAADFHADQRLAAPRHQDAFYLRMLRSALALAEGDAARAPFFLAAAVKFKTSWKRWIGFGPGEEATLDIRL